MKKLYLLMVIMLCIILSQYKTKAASCCTYITVEHSVTDSCCVDIHVNNPYCDGAVITLEIDGGGTWSEVYKDSVTSSPVIRYCPPGGSGFVKYRVRFTQPFHPGRPYCGGDGPYQEGYTQFTDSLYLECCEDCPEGFENWFNLESKKSNNCPDYGCEITHTFHIPDSIDCYTGYKVETDSNSTSFLSFTGDSLAWIDGCISAGTTFHAKVILYTANGDSCIIEDSVFCDEPRDTNDLQEPCVPDCFETPFSSPDSARFRLMGCNGGNCFIQVFYVHRHACNQWYDIQILRIEKSAGCAGCSDAYIYHQALLGIISLNKMNFPPDSTGCSSVWRVTQGGCWSEWEYYVIDPNMGVVDTIKVLEPCTLTECCLQEMTVCKTQNPPTITITYNSPYVPPYINCDDTWLEDPLSGWIVQCTPKCDWLEDFEGVHTPPDTVWAWGKKAIELEPKSYNKIGIQIYQLDDYIQLQLRNEGLQNISIRITDVLGKERLSSEHKLVNGDNIIKVPKSKLTTGAYILTIIADNYLIKTEKFIVK